MSRKIEIDMYKKTEYETNEEYDQRRIDIINRNIDTAKHNAQCMIDMIKLHADMTKRYSELEVENRLLKNMVDNMLSKPVRVIHDSVLDKNIEELFSIRTWNTLSAKGIRTIGALAQTKENTIKGWTKSPKVRKEIKEVLSDYNLTLGTDIIMGDRIQGE